jgi:hypothetical protein
VVEPVPWLARAVLGREGRSSPARGALRAALTCAPLRDAVVARCLSWEARLRGAYVPVGQPPPRAAAAFADLERGQGPDRAGYPPECPALPRSAWELVPLGEFVSALPATPAARVMNEVRTLRNSMAHGHYVSWATLLRADALDAGLGPRPIRDRDAR